MTDVKADTVSADIHKQNNAIKHSPLEWTVYVLLNAENITYTGIAKDIDARLIKHNASKGARFTKGRGPWTIIYTEGPLTHADALRRELDLKSDASFKLRLKEANCMKRT